MVRFSDMLGGDGEPDDAQSAGTEPDLPPPGDADEVPDDAAEATELSPRELLDRLTEYASATRGAELQGPDAPVPEANEPEPERDPPGDDILPRAKRSLRNPRGKRS
jgi:hypothetical protein